MRPTDSAFIPIRCGFGFRSSASSVRRAVFRPARRAQHSLHDWLELLNRVRALIRGGILGAALAASTGASAQTTQLWTNVTLDWVKSSRLTYEVDFEPKALISAPPDDPGWRNLDVTPSVEFAAHETLDLVGELTTGVTKQTDEVSTTEVTVRAGARLHLFSRLDRLLAKEKLP